MVGPLLGGGEEHGRGGSGEGDQGNVGAGGERPGGRTEGPQAVPWGSRELVDVVHQEQDTGEHSCASGPREDQLREVL